MSRFRELTSSHRGIFRKKRAMSTMVWIRIWKHEWRYNNKLCWCNLHRLMSGFCSTSHKNGSSTMWERTGGWCNDRVATPWLLLVHADTPRSKKMMQLHTARYNQSRVICKHPKDFKNRRHEGLFDFLISWLEI